MYCSAGNWERLLLVPKAGSRPSVGTRWDSCFKWSDTLTFYTLWDLICRSRRYRGCSRKRICHRERWTY